MAILKAVARLPYFTGVPEDVVVNTFHFATVAAPTTGQKTTMVTAVADFYSVTNGSGTVGTYLAPFLSRTANICTVTLYDLGDAEPRQPIDEVNFTLPASAGTGTLPGEVAKCLSYRATYASGSSNARRRGRIYVGPLSSAALTVGTGTAFPIPNTNFDDALILSAELHLFDGPLADGVNWVVYSPTDNIARNVVEVWVDNAFDTQRRRGNAPTARQSAFL